MIISLKAGHYSPASKTPLHDGPSLNACLVFEGLPTNPIFLYFFEGVGVLTPVLQPLDPRMVCFHQFEPVHEISNNMVCATSKASDQPAHTRSLIRAFASRLSIL